MMGENDLFIGIIRILFLTLSFSVLVSCGVTNPDPTTYNTAPITPINGLVAIITAGKIPNNLSNYNQPAQDIFGGYAAGTPVTPRYTAAGGSGNKSGTNWANAAANLKTVLEGIIDASSNQVYAVLLGPGEYKSGGSMAMKNYVTIVGGVSPANGLGAGPTILSGDNSYTVFLHDKNGLTSAARLYGVTIADGKNNNGNLGGGMHNDSSSPVLTEVVFTGNTAVTGGGMHNWTSSPILTGVVFSGNTATFIGGGMYNYDSSSPVLSRVFFTGNTATYTGGGMFNDSSSPILTGVVFSGNMSDDSGGGMYNFNYSSPILTGVLFSGNTANTSGGGMYNENSSPILTGVVFSGNTANISGGGMYNENSSPVLTGLLFSRNTAKDSGGGMVNDSSTPALTGVVFSGNMADISGGGMYNYNSSSPVLTGLVFFGNTASNSGSGMYNNNSSPTAVNTIFWGQSVSNIGGGSVDFYYSVVEGGTPDTTNNIITNDPGLLPLADNGGGIQTMAIPADSPAKDKGLYVRRKGSTNYYSIDNKTWYDTPKLNNAGAAAVNLPGDEIDLTETDMTGYQLKPGDGRPDIGVVEVRSP